MRDWNSKEGFRGTTAAASQGAHLGLNVHWPQHAAAARRQLEDAGHVSAELEPIERRRLMLTVHLRIRGADVSRTQSDDEVINRMTLWPGSCYAAN